MWWATTAVGEQSDQMVSQGGRAASSVAEACQAADFVITMPPDSPDVEEVAFGDAGILASVRLTCVYIDMSTIRPATARQFARVGEEAGIGVLDAPVSGGDRAAAERTLSIMVGGSVSDFELAVPILQALGSTVVHVGPAGSGQTVKAANQLVQDAVKVSRVN